MYIQRDLQKKGPSSSKRAFQKRLMYIKRDRQKKPTHCNTLEHAATRFNTLQQRTGGSLDFVELRVVKW